MAETHPMLEAMARAAERAYVETRIEALRVARDHVMQAAIEPSAWRAGALAAARVILSAEPSDAQMVATVEEMPDERPMLFDARRAVRASNAALLREIEGSEPATRDVGT